MACTGASRLECPFAVCNLELHGPLCAVPAVALSVQCHVLQVGDWELTPSAEDRARILRGCLDLMPSLVRD